MRKRMMILLLIPFLTGCFSTMLASCSDSSSKEYVAPENNDGNGEKDDEDDEEEIDPDDPLDLRNYKLHWSDEFEAGEVNEAYWNYQIDGGGGGNNELQYYKKENVKIGVEPVSGESCLIITAKKESAPNGRLVTSGRVNTSKKFAFQYGRIDGRVKLPKTANGLWPAFWMMGDDYDKVGWPRCGEIDIMEMGHINGIRKGQQETLFNGAAHWGPIWSSHYMHAQEKVWPTSLQDGDFHIWTMIWDEKSLNMYVDLDRHPEQKPFFTLNIEKGSDENDKSTSKYFHKPFHVLINLAVGGDFTGIVGNHNLNKITGLDDGPAQMYVDYVRVYQRK